MSEFWLGMKIYFQPKLFEIHGFGRKCLGQLGQAIIAFSRKFSEEQPIFSIAC
jgi:hypothetical protein